MRSRCWPSSVPNRASLCPTNPSPEALDGGEEIPLALDVDVALQPLDAVGQRTQIGLLGERGRREGEADDEEEGRAETRHGDRPCGIVGRRTRFAVAASGQVSAPETAKQGRLPPRPGARGRNRNARREDPAGVDRVAEAALPLSSGVS